ncbi:MAG: hypothetical protein AABX52_04640 [Nanoarchaeota archaeon]
MVLTLYDWAYGIGQLSAVFLSIIAGLIAISMFRLARRQPLLRGWKFLIWSLVLFAVEEVVGALRTFGVSWYFSDSPWLTHVIPTFVLALLIVALSNQININKGWYHE